MNAKVKVQLTTSKLSWTHKFPQSEMFSQEIKSPVVAQWIWRRPSSDRSWARYPGATLSQTGGQLIPLCSPETERQAQSKPGCWSITESSQEIKKQTELWICQFFYRVSVYYPFWFLFQMALVRPYCRDIVQSSLVHHHKPWFQQEDQTCKLLSTTGSLGITNTCTKPAPVLYKFRKFYNAYATGGSTKIFLHFRTPVRYP